MSAINYINSSLKDQKYKHQILEESMRKAFQMTPEKVEYDDEAYRKQLDEIY